jgi:cystathionine beta-lyase/cystathionine gamma-synthase
MNITDIHATSKVSRAAGAWLCVDNTFASPYLQNPLDLGADIVMHSSTKYLGGHSDVIQGALIMNDDSLREQLYFIQKSCGAVPGPMDCFLVLRGIKNLACAHEAALRKRLCSGAIPSQAPGRG